MAARGAGCDFAATDRRRFALVLCGAPRAQTGMAAATAAAPKQVVAIAISRMLRLRLMITSIPPEG